MDACVSVYVDWSANERDVRDAIAGLAMPAGVSSAHVTSTMTDNLGCRVAVDLIGAFDETTDVARSLANMRQHCRQRLAGYRRSRFTT